MRNATQLVAALVSLLIFAPCLANAQFQFDPGIMVEPDTNPQYGCCLVSDSQGNPCISWTFEEPYPGPRREVRFSRSTDGGLTFMQSTLIDSPAWGRSSLVLDSGDNPLVALVSGWESGGRLHFVRSTDGGQSFLPSIEVDTLMANSHELSLALDPDGNPCIAWLFADELRFSRSTDGGDTWLPSTRIWSSPNRQWTPSMGIAQDGMIFIAYREGWMYTPWLYVIRSTDSGQSWLPPVLVDEDSLSNGTPSLRVAADGNPYMAWVKEDTCRVYFSRSTDRGDEFIKPVMVDTSPQSQFQPSLVLDQFCDPMVAYTTSQTDLLYFVCSFDSGQTFLPRVAVDSTEAGSQAFPSLTAAPGGDALAAWEDSRQPNCDCSQIFFSRGHRVGVEEVQEARRRMQEARLFQNQPNPCREFTIINYQLPKPASTVLRIYDMSGRLVRTLVDDEKEPGSHTVTWDGKGENGLPVATGVYFCRLSAGELSAMKKLVVLR